MLSLLSGDGYDPVTGVPQSVSAFAPSQRPMPRLTPRPTVAVSNYNPSWREKARWWLGDKLGGTRADYRNAARIFGTPQQMGALDITPFGMALGANEGYRTWDRASKNGNIFGALLGTAQFGMNVLPLGMEFGAAGKAVARSPMVRREAGRFVADQSGSLSLWHGSSSKFESFKLGKPGGVGAQAYGQGAYLSDAQKVSENYAKQTAQFQNSNMINASGGDLSKAVDFAKKRMKSYRDLVAEKRASNSPDYPLAVKKFNDAKFRFERMKKIRDGEIDPNGYTYRANVVSDQSTFFDYKGDLGKQDWKIRAAFGKYGRPGKWETGTPVGSGKLVVKQSEIDPNKQEYFVRYPNGVESKVSAQELTDYIGNPETDQISAGAAFKRIVAEKGERGAVAFLKNRGVPGAKMQDNMGRGTNYVVYDPKTISVIERNGKLLPNRLIAHTNVSDAAIPEIDRLGGIPMPSTAISNVDHPLEGFGDISLVSEPPIPSPKNPIYPGDAYTGRQPKARTKIYNESKMVKNFQGDPVFGGITDAARIPYYYGQNLDMADRNIKVIQAALEKGIDPAQFKGVDTFAAKEKARIFLSKNGFVNNSETQPGVAAFGKAKRIYPMGMTDSGNWRRPLPATAENALKIMRKDKAYLNSTEAGSHVGPAAFRAAVTPRMRNLSAVKASRGQVQSPEKTKPVFDAFEEKFYALSKKLMKNFPREISFDSAMQAMQDIGSGKRADWMPGIVDKIPQETKDEIRALAAESRSLPTNYMEMKPNKIMKLGDYKAAVIPEGTDPAIKDILRKNGIKTILEYPEGKRAEVMRKLPQLMFGVGGLTFYQMGVKNVAKALGLPADHFSQEDAKTYRDLTPRQKINFWTKYKGA